MQSAATHRLDRIDTTLAALADPVRRRVVQALGSGPRRAGDIAAMFPLSGPAVSKHLRVLRRCNLIVEERDHADARVRLYRLAPEPLHELGGWVDQLRAFWSEQLQSFYAYALTEAQGAGLQPPASAPHPSPTSPRPHVRTASARGAKARRPIRRRTKAKP
jgi:DNA-binding transcriptional ArsR family regulator